MFLGRASEIDSLQQVSARMGSDPLLVQAATGNTSIKLDGVLWIKASGKWLAQAESGDIMIPVNLAETRRRIELNIDPAGQLTILNGKRLGTSVETAMHAVLPWRVVLHVHSVNTIAWAVRRDGAAKLASRLDGLDWHWVPYAASGMPLASAVEETLRRAPRTKVLILANHGLVVCGEDCESAEALLKDVERRVTQQPRTSPEPKWRELTHLAKQSSWELPQTRAVHAVGTDSVALRTVSGGVLYPCQAIFLTPRARTLHAAAGAGELGAFEEPFVIIEDAGVVVRAHSRPATLATLDGLAQVALRIPESAPIHYLRDDDVRDLLCADVYRYRSIVEDNSGPVATSAVVTAQ